MKYFKVLAGLAVSAVCLWLAFRNIHMGEVMRVILGANLPLIGLSLVVALTGFAFRCLRWKIIGREKYESVGWKVFFKATSMGLMLNTFVPMRGGDIFQAYVLGKKAGVSKSYALSTVLIERLIDLGPPVLIIVISSVFIPLPALITLPRIFAILGAGFLALCLIALFGRRIVGIFDAFLAARHAEKIRALMDNFLSGLELIKEPTTLAKVSGLTALMWSLSCVSTYLILESLGIKLPFFAAFTVTAVTVISVAIPSSPGYVGIWEFFAMMALGIFGIDKNIAAGFAVVYHFLALLPITVLGLYFLLRDLQSFRAAGKE